MNKLDEISELVKDFKRQLEATEYEINDGKAGWCKVPGSFLRAKDLKIELLEKRIKKLEQDITNSTQQLASNKEYIAQLRGK